LGSAYTPDFVAVPEIGGLVIQWLQGGVAVEECARRAAERAGEPVDVAGFLDGLTAAGLLRAEDTEPPPILAAGKRRAGRALFGPIGLSVQVALALAAVAMMITTPRVRPAYTDAIATRVPLLSIVVLMIMGAALGLLHELAHVLAAWAAGISSRISIGRRMLSMVYQTDLTRLWSVPRRRRIVPLAAGIIFDGATIGIVMLGEVTSPLQVPSMVAHLARTIVFLNVTAIAYQFLIFLRTDVYALFLLATGCKNLWGTKGALARRAVGRATDEDTALLASVGRREIAWGRVFLCLYVPGALFTAWYFVVFAGPALMKIITTAWDAIFADGLLSLGGAAGTLAVAVTAASTAFVLWGLTRTTLRLIRS
ncbi:MAG TPA: hypothetical protein VGF84_08940, partial [Micromonosporaceae bacterium]